MSNLTANRCAICGASVGTEQQEAHLLQQHPVPPGGFRFHFEGRRFAADKPSMLIVDLITLVRGDPAGLVFEERDGERHYLSHGNAIDLTREPWLFIDLPAVS